MTGPHGLLPAFLLALAVAGAARADEEDRGHAAEDVWHARPWPPPPVRGAADLLEEEFSDVDLPEARRAWEVWPAVDRMGPRFVLAFPADGTVCFAGWAYDLRAEADEGEGIERLRRDLRRFMTPPSGTEPSVIEGSAVMVQADRSVDSRRVLSVLALLEGGPFPPELEIAVMDWDTHRPGALRFRLETASGSAVPAAVLAGEGQSVRLSIGDVSWRFRTTSHRDDPASVREANATWAEVRSRLVTMSQAHPALALDAGESGRAVPFAWVVTLLDLMAAAGAGRIDLPETGLTLLPRPAPAPVSRDERLDEQWPGPLWILGCALLALAAFVVTLLPLRAGRRRS